MNRRLIIAGLLAAVAVVCFRRWWPEHSFLRTGARLESALDKELLSGGITDRQILSVVHRERSKWGFDWVETTRRIQISDRSHLEGLWPGLKVVAVRSGCEISRADA